MRREMRGIFGVLPVALAALAVTTANAAHAGEPDEVVVHAPRAAGFVSRARVEDSPRDITDAASLIEPMPGVHVRRLGADDSFATLSVRGTSSTQVAIYLGGVPLSGGADPTLDLATLPLWPGSSARVYRSFAPAALGRGSLGGTLVLDLPSARTPNGTEVYVAAGAYGSRRVRVGDVSGDPEGVRVATGFSASRSEDDFSYVDGPASSAAGREVLATRENAGHAAASGLASIAIPVRLGAGTTGALGITTLAQVRRQQLPGSITLPTRFQRLDSNRLLGALELTLPAASGAASARLWPRRDGLDIHGGSRGERRQAQPERDRRCHHRVGWQRRAGKDDPASSPRSRRGSTRAASASRRAAGWAPPSHRARGARARASASMPRSARARTSRSPRARAPMPGSNSADDGVATHETKPTGNVGAELVLGDVTLATHGGALARPPSFVERYGDHGIFPRQPRAAARVRVHGRRRRHVRVHARRRRPRTPRARSLRDVGRRSHRVPSPWRVRVRARREHRARPPPRDRGRAPRRGVRHRAPALAHRARHHERGRLPLRGGDVRATLRSPAGPRTMWSATSRTPSGGCGCATASTSWPASSSTAPATSGFLRASSTRPACASRSPGAPGLSGRARRAQPVRPPCRTLPERPRRDRPLPDRRSLRLPHPRTPPPRERSLGLSRAECQC